LTQAYPVTGVGREAEIRGRLSHFCCHSWVRPPCNPLP
jgi:hypothetical protein